MPRISRTPTWRWTTDTGKIARNTRGIRVSANCSADEGRDSPINGTIPSRLSFASPRNGIALLNTSTECPSRRPRLRIENTSLVHFWQPLEHDNCISNCIPGSYKMYLLLLMQVCHITAYFTNDRLCYPCSQERVSCRNQNITVVAKIVKIEWIYWLLNLGATQMRISAVWSKITSSHIPLIRYSEIAVISLVIVELLISADKFVSHSECVWQQNTIELVAKFNQLLRFGCDFIKLFFRV